ncbi:MAG: hypothetical protein ABIG44_16020 [Planctomycetota bacterium]
MNRTRSLHEFSEPASSRLPKGYRLGSDGHWEIAWAIIFNEVLHDLSSDSEYSFSRFGKPNPSDSPILDAATHERRRQAMAARKLPAL